jgi:hypothetical protein
MVTAKNPITGDNLHSGSTSQAFRDNYDAIFRKKEHEPENEPECSESSVPAPPEFQEAVNAALKQGKDDRVQWPFPTKTSGNA